MKKYLFFIILLIILVITSNLPQTITFTTKQYAKNTLLNIKIKNIYAFPLKTYHTSLFEDQIDDFEIKYVITDHYFEYELPDSTGTGTNTINLETLEQDFIHENTITNQTGTIQFVWNNEKHNFESTNNKVYLHKFIK